MTEIEELGRRLAEVEARERDVARRERTVEAKSVRHGLYDRINVSTRTMDIIIAVCVAAIAALIALGLYMR